MNQTEISEHSRQITNYEKLEPILGRLTNINLTILKGRLERGMWLKRIKDNKLFVGHDGWVHTWAEFLDNISIARETARQDMEIYEQFASYLQNNPNLMNQLSYERLVRLLPVVKNDHNDKPLLLEMAASTNRADFDNNLKELKGKMPTDMCDCETVIILARCTVCGATHRRKDLE
tara:strand:+ start:4640 stop:5167 length:528 start_codon:yes stop_codon:yes gene_type:complete